MRGYRAPRPEDDNSDEIRARLEDKLPEWEAFDIVPNERFPEDGNDTRPIQYGMPLWRDLFSPRQLLCHGTSVEVFREMLEADQKRAGRLNDVRKAAYGYLALSLDKLLNYNCRLGRWHSRREVVAGTFDRHDFRILCGPMQKWPLWSQAWATTGPFDRPASASSELVALVRPETQEFQPGPAGRA